MTQPVRRPPPPPAPERDHLKAVRLALFRLHKALIDAERAAFEADVGEQSSGQFLQALIHEPFFAWLRPFSGLLVRIDEALATREPLEPGAAKAFVSEAAALVMPADAEDETAARFAAIRAADPGVAFLHAELTRRIGEGPAGG
ncbi:MAG: hypothetical protein JWM27_3242 [Gemmatimonadetes bacterium]|nr:hypothetical protein [Gemmatimonadota bacterium]